MLAFHLDLPRPTTRCRDPRLTMLRPLSILVRKKLGLAVLLLVLFLLPCTTSRAAAAADQPDPATKYLLYDWHPMFQAGLSLIQSTMEKSDRLTLVVEDIYNRRNQMKTRTFSQALDPCLRTFPKNYLLALKSGGPPPRKWLNQKALLAFTSLMQQKREERGLLPTSSSGSSTAKGSTSTSSSSLVNTMKKDPHWLDFVEEPPGPAPFLVYENMILERVEKHNYYCPVVKPDVYTFHGRYFDKHFQFRFDGKTQCGHRKHIPVALTIHQDMEHLLQLDAMAAAAAAKEKDVERREGEGVHGGPASVSNVRGSDEGDDWGGVVTAEAIELEAAEKKHQLRKLEHQGRESHIVVDKQSGGFIASLLPTMATDAWSGTHGNYNAESTSSASSSPATGSTRKLDAVEPVAGEDADEEGGAANSAEGTTTSITEGAIMNKPTVLTLRVPHLGRNLLTDHTPDLELLDGGRECLRRDFGDFFQDHDICVLFGGKRSPSVCAGSMAERIYYVPFLMFSFIRSHHEYATFVDQDLPKVKASVAPSFLDMGFLEYASGVGNFVQEQQIWYTRKYLLEQKRVRKEFDLMHSDAVWDPAEGEEPLKRNNFVLIGGRKLPGSHGGASGDDAVLSFYLNLVGRMVTDLQRRLRSFYKSNLALQKRKMREGSMVEKSPPPRRPAEEVAQATLVKTSTSPEDEDGNVLPEQEKEALQRIGLRPADKDLCFWPRYRNLKDYKRFGCEVKIRTMLEEFADDQALVRNDDFLCEDSCGRTVLDPLHGLNDYAEWAVASRQASVPAVQKRPAGIQGAADMGMAAQGVCITYGPLLCRKYKMDKDKTLIRIEAAGNETGKNSSGSRHLPLDETQRVNAISMRDIDNSQKREQKALMHASERRKRVFYPPSAAAAKAKPKTPSSTPPRNKLNKKIRSHWPVVVETFPRHFSQRHFSFEQVLRDVKALVCFPYSSSALFWSEMHALGIPIFIPSVELLWQYHLQVQLGAKYASLRKNVKFMATPLDINKVQSLIDENVLVLDRRAKTNARGAAPGAGAGAGAAKKGGYEDRVSPNVAKTIAEWVERQEEQELRRQIGEEAFEKLGKEFRKKPQSTREPNVVAPSKVIANQEGFWFPQQESVFFHDEDAQPTRQKWQIMPGNRTHRMQMRLVRAWFDKTKIFSKTEWANVTGVNATNAAASAADTHIQQDAHAPAGDLRTSSSANTNPSPALRDEFYATRAPGAAHGLIANEILASMHPAGNSSRGFDARFPEESIVLGGGTTGSSNYGDHEQQGARTVHRSWRPHANCTRFCPEEPELSPWRMFESRTAFYYWLGKMDLYHWGPHVRHYHNVSHLFSMIKDHELLDAMRRRQLVRSKEMNERGEQVFRAAMEEIKQGEAYKERGRGR